MMTRIEEILHASREYNNSITFSNPSNVLHFEAGAKWADEHPDVSHLWHDASEIPNNHSYIMLMIDKYTIKTDYIPACLNHCQLNHTNWNAFVKDVNIKQWAYVSDLLPKLPKGDK